MRTTNIVFALILAVVFAIPGPAFGQSAGDEQYTDPFQEETDSGAGGGEQQGGGQPQPQVEEPQAPAPTLAPTPEAAPEAEATDTTVGSVESAQSSSAAPSATNTLPATGFPAALTAVLGAVLLLGGTVSRRALR